MSPARSGATATWPRRLLAGVDAGSDGDLYTAHLSTWGPLPAAASLSGPAVVEMVEESGLVGRGGAGFPAGRKMRTVAAGASRRPVVVANGAEGEPASGKDVLLLGRAPHLVLDGIQLAARAVGADEAHLAVHRGSPVVGVVRAAVDRRRGADAIPVQVHEIPWRYVASEETALVHYLNGGEARPTFTPPRPFEQGVGRRPTLVNNVETLAHVAAIARRGADWFREVGDPDEPGTMLVSISGRDISRRIAEVPTGTTIGAVADRAGVDREGVAAVLVGGYFGSWLPAAYAWQLPLTHRAMRSAGAALGAGVLAVLPSTACGVAETARVVSYLAAHNAGQCGPCLNGLPAIADALRRLASGGWDERWWPALERWMAVVPGRCVPASGRRRTVRVDGVVGVRRGRGRASIRPAVRGVGRRRLVAGAAARGGLAMTMRIRVNPISCEAHGLCAEMLPEWIELDEWGYPILDGEELPRQLVAHARRAAKACPTLAIVLSGE